jgi:ABC-2 type transport system ATP-binding protein
MVEVKNLVKTYGTFRAVNNVSFSVGQEEVLGFLGPNGAGKTTVMKILTGYHFPSGGEALVDGISVVDDPLAVKERIGYLPELVPLYGDLTVEEYLGFAANVRGIAPEKRQTRIDAAIDSCGLGSMRHRRIEALSKGYKQRTGLAQAILHDPSILILDEPTTGLDPNQIIEIRALIKELGRSNTVILSTHILQEVESVCTKVLILNEGRIAASGTPEQIAGTMKGGETWDLLLKPGNSGDALSSSSEGYRIELKISNMDAGGGRKPENIAVGMGENGVAALSFFIADAGTALGENESAERIFDWAVSQNYKILGMSRKKLSLEDIFVKLTS